MKGVKFGGYHSWSDFSLILSQKIIGAPEPKTEVIDIPGGDGALDLTEFFGEVKYSNRLLTFIFSTKTITPEEYLLLYSRVQNAIHGQKLQIILDDDTTHYYYGRVTINEWKSDKNIGEITIEVDAEPYKYNVTETVVAQAVSDKATITLANGRKRVIPQITTSAEMKIAYNGFSGTYSAGTFRIPELELKEGNNKVTVTGTGNITFSYREGGL